MVQRGFDMNALPAGEPGDVLTDLDGYSAFQNVDELLPFVVVLYSFMLCPGLDRHLIPPQVLVGSGPAERNIGIGIHSFLVAFGTALCRFGLLLRLQFIHVQLQHTAELENKGDRQHGAILLDPGQDLRQISRFERKILNAHPHLLPAFFHPLAEGLLLPFRADHFLPPRFISCSLTQSRTIPTVEGNGLNKPRKVLALPLPKDF